MQFPLPSTAVRLPGNFSESAFQFPSSRDNYTPSADKDHQREEQQVFKLELPTAPWPSSWASQLHPPAPVTQGTFPATGGLGSLSFQGGFLNQPLVAQFQHVHTLPSGPYSQHFLAALSHHHSFTAPTQKSPQQPTAPQSNLWFESKQWNQSKSIKTKTDQNYPA